MHMKIQCYLQQKSLQCCLDGSTINYHHIIVSSMFPSQLNHSVHDICESVLHQCNKVCMEMPLKYWVKNLTNLHTAKDLYIYVLQNLRCRPPVILNCSEHFLEYFKSNINAYLLAWCCTYFRFLGTPHLLHPVLTLFTLLACGLLLLKKSMLKEKTITSKKLYFIWHCLVGYHIEQ